MIFRAAAGFALALTFLHWPGYWAGLKTPSLHVVETDIAATHPAARLDASLNEWLVPQNGTAIVPKTPENRARGLHF